MLQLNELIGTLTDGQAVKQWVANRVDLAGGSKLAIFNIYKRYCQWKGLQFDIPKVRNVEAALPYIPKLDEINQLIEGMTRCRKLQTFCLTLLETGGRLSEILNVLWKDLDIAAPTLNIKALKGGRNRQARISPQLAAKLNLLPKENEFIFGGITPNGITAHFDKVRKRLAKNNPNLMRIHFHSFRHYFGSRLYFQTKDIVRTQQRMGHRSILSTMRYVQLVDFGVGEPEFEVKEAADKSVAMQLIANGYEYTGFQQLFRKRK